LFYNPLIAASGETTSTSQVFPKGLVARACCCALGDEPWVYPYANTPILFYHGWSSCNDVFYINDETYKKIGALASNIEALWLNTNISHLAYNNWLTSL
jgi:hypothetical protein